MRLHLVEFTLSYVFILPFRNSFFGAITAVWIQKYLIKNIYSAQEPNNLRLQNT